MIATIERHRERSLSELPVWVRAICQGGDDFTNHGYTTKFAARKAVLLSAVRRGWTCDECFRVFLADPALPAYELWASSRTEIGPHGRLKRLQEDYRQCLAHAANTPAPPRSSGDARAQIGEIIAEAAIADFPGVSGRTDRDVLKAVHATGTEYGSMSVILPARDIALRAGVSRTTAAKSLGRLVTAGWIKRTVKVEGWPTGVYVITRGKEVYHNGTYLGQDPDSNMSTCGTPDPAHETWVTLGKAAKAAWSALDTEPRSCREIARRASIGNCTSLRVLRVLAECALAIRDDDKKWIRGEANPDEVASLHSFDTVARRKKQYEVERAANDYKAQQADIEAGSPIGRKSYSAKPRSEHVELNPVAAKPALVSVPDTGTKECCPPGRNCPWCWTVEAA